MVRSCDVSICVANLRRRSAMYGLGGWLLVPIDSVENLYSIVLLW